MALLRRRRRAPLLRDDFGGGADGSLAIFDVAAERGVHTTSARVAASLRYLVARVRIHDGEEFPACLALTAALKGEGATFITHSLASVIAYDTARSVVVVDLNWAAPAGAARRRRRSLRSGGGTPPASPPTAIPAFQPGVIVAGEPSFGRRPIVDVPDDSSSFADPVEPGDLVEPVAADEESDAPNASATADDEQVTGDDQDEIADDDVDADDDDAADDDDDADDAADDTDDDDDTDDTDGEGSVRAPARALIDVINGSASLDEVIRATSNPRLSLIQPGVAAFAHRPGLAGDPRLRAIVEELRERFDHVLLDLPPVLSSSEAIILAELADAFVLVVRQGVTSEQHIAAALEELQGSQSLGVVLNRVESSVPKPLRRLLGV